MKNLFFYAVVTNLSEGGLFAEFIQSNAEECAKEILDPYDLKFLYFKMDLPTEETIEGCGKLIHGSVSDGGVGVEFYEIKKEGRKSIAAWIEKHLSADK